MRTERPRTNPTAFAASFLFLLALCMGLPAGARAQWTTDTGAQKTTTSDKVGVGTAAPQAKLDVEGTGTAVRATFGGNSVVGGVGPHGKFQLYSKDLPNHPFAEMQMYSPTANADEYLRFNIGNSSGSIFADVLTIGRTGRVGVGTASPESRFHVANPSGLGDLSLSGSGAAAMSFVDTAAAANQRRYQWRSGGGLFRMTLVNDADNGVFVQQNILVANSAGNVGVGTASPAFRLDVAGSVNASGLCLGGACKTSWAEVGGSQWAGGASGAISYGSGNVGIGTASPGQLLDVSGAGDVKARATGTNSAALMLQESAGAATWSEWQQYGDRLRLNAGDGAAVRTDVMSVTPGGKVGIGQANPAEALDVLGNVKVTGDVIASGNVQASFQDVAEWVPSVQKLSAGTVVVLDAGRTNHVVASATVYDTKVAGVVSAQPGVILGVAGEGKVMVATTGRVKVRVDATRGAIRVGDLLVTSGVEGVAMKSVPVDLGGTPIHRPGTIIGKALEPLDSGMGEILVLLSLQ
ncbi:MAG TPA: hypothetical protein VF297_11135 [Pyrinomonadaceae bacterium]